jgi:hypothetical protein
MTTRLDWSAAGRGLCVVCGDVVPNTAMPVCRTCGRPATVTIRPLTTRSPTREVFVGDAKSDCCGADVDLPEGTHITCSRRCHERFVAELERQFGKEKVVIDQATGRRHLVPTRTLIERGVRQEELGSFPEAPP